MIWAIVRVDSTTLIDFSWTEHVWSEEYLDVINRLTKWAQPLRVTWPTAARSPRVMLERGKLATEGDMRFDHMSNLVVPVLGV